MAANRKGGIADEMVDGLLNGRYRATVFETKGLVDELKKRLAEWMLNSAVMSICARWWRGKWGVESPQRLRLQDGADGFGQAGACDCQCAQRLVLLNGARPVASSKMLPLSEVS